MKRVYKFIAGNSRVTPIGIALAAASAFVFRGALGPWTGAVYVGILALTLVIATCEPVE